MTVRNFIKWGIIWIMNIRSFNKNKIYFDRVSRRFTKNPRVSKLNDIVKDNETPFTHEHVFEFINILTPGCCYTYDKYFKYTRDVESFELRKLLNYKSFKEMTIR